MRTLLPIAGACLLLGGCMAPGAKQHGDASRAPAVAAGPAAPAAIPNPDEYRAPAEFFGYAWGTPFLDIPHLKLVPGGVALAAGYQGKVMDIQIRNCTPIPGGAAAGPCRIHQRVQGAGSYVMASYYRDFEPYNPYPGTRPAAAIYYFCARTGGDFVSRHVTERLELCGGELIFQSEFPKIRHAGAPDTNYDRVVDALIARHGRPDNFRYSGHVTVEDQFGTHTLPTMRRYRPLYWCRITQHALDPSCEATITLDFDSETGTGRVLFATDGVYRMAEALHELSDEKIPLYERLHGFAPDRYKSRRRVCTGTHLCGGDPRPLTEEELAYFEPEAD